MTVAHQITDNSAVIPVESLPHILDYDGEGRLVAVSVLYEGVEYVQSLTYDAEGRLSSVSAWEAQP